jgi:hypothetical protein
VATSDSYLGKVLLAFMSTWQAGAGRRSDVAIGERGSQESCEWCWGDTGILKEGESVEKTHQLYFNL